MSGLPPKTDGLRGRGARIPRPKPADYSDEISTEQLALIRAIVTQDERKMGPVVHEFAW